MTLRDLRKKVEEAERKLAVVLADLEAKEALLVDGKDIDGDGDFDIDDRDLVKQVRKLRDAAQQSHGKLMHRLLTAEAKAKGEKPEEITFDEGETILGDNRAGAARLFSADRTAFITQIGLWRVEVREKVGAMLNSMLSDSKDGAEFPAEDILKATAAIVKPLGLAVAAVDTGKSLVNIINQAYAKSLPKSATLRQMETEWRRSVDELTDAEAGKGFDLLVKNFIKDKGMEPGDDMVYPVYVSDWNALLNSFRAGEALPTGEAVAAALMALIIRKMPDSLWDLDRSAGEVTVYLEFDPDKQKFTFRSGSMDDISDEVQRGLKANDRLFGADRLILLPAQLRFVVSAPGFFNKPLFECYRKDDTSGSLDFKISLTPLGRDANMAEQNTLFRYFLQEKAYDIVKISDIL